MLNMHSFWCFILLWCVVRGYTSKDLERLKEHLFVDYDPTIRPIFNQSKQIKIDVSFVVRSLVNFDMTNGQLDTMSYITAIWKDEKMSWNGTEFDEIPRISLTEDTLWIPQIAQLNAIADDVPLSSLILFRDGTVMRANARKFSTFCELNMRYYPNDGHVCKFEFMSINYLAGDLLIVSRSEGADITGLAPHGEWTVSETSTAMLSIGVDSLGVQGEGIIYTLVLVRQPSFKLIHELVPLVILALCTVFVHVVPLNSGERISYAVTILLAFVFWQALVADGLPKNSSNISIFSIVITVFLCISGSFTIISAVFCRVYSFDPDKHIPETIQKLTRRCRRRKKSKETFHRQMSHESTNAKKDDDMHVYMNGKRVVNVDKSIPNNNENIMADNPPVTWPEAAHALDMMLFVIHGVGAIVFTTVFVLIFTSKDQQ